jgi:hypothetical protein
MRVATCEKSSDSDSRMYQPHGAGRAGVRGAHITGPRRSQLSEWRALDLQVRQVKGGSMEETQEMTAAVGLVCRECGEGIEFDLWHETLGPLCERCHEKSQTERK